MLKKTFVFIVLWSLSLSVDAGFYERDWLTDGDGFLTYVSELNIEIIDMTFTNTGHADMSNKLLNDAMFSGFRFMKHSEISTIMKSFVGHGNIGDTFDISLSESARIVEFLDLLGGSISGGFNTCDFDFGCNVTPSYTLDGGGLRHLISPYNLYYGDDDTATSNQFIVRDVPVPAAGLLFMTALVGLAGKRRLSRR